MPIKYNVDDDVVFNGHLISFVSELIKLRGKMEKFIFNRKDDVRDVNTFLTVSRLHQMINRNQRFDKFRLVDLSLDDE